MPDKIKLLVVEDEFLIAILLQRNLEVLGYEIGELVISGEEAIESVEKERPDVILMDIRLGGAMDGIEAAEVICARHDIPIVFMTGYSDEATMERAMKLQPVAFLIKPVGPYEIRAVIDTVFKDQGPAGSNGLD